jgi:hypothetical protein
MNSFEIAPGQAARLRETFTEIQDAEALLRPSADRSRRKRMSAGMLYAAACAGEGPDSESLGARRFYRQAVADTARFALPLARAASSSLALARHGDGCNIRIERSRAEPDQYFVLVEMAKDARTSPTSLIVCDAEDRCQRFALPVARDGISQIVAESDSDLMRLISDPASKVYLR